MLAASAAPIIAYIGAHIAVTGGPTALLARSASGHTAMPPASVMNSRRLMGVPMSWARASFGQPGFAKAVN
jgi:hypothetical protein